MSNEEQRPIHPRPTTLALVNRWFAAKPRPDRMRVIGHAPQPFEVVTVNVSAVAVLGMPLHVGDIVYAMRSVPLADLNAQVAVNLDDVVAVVVAVKEPS